ncbi:MULTISPECIES: ABC transporter permease [Streptomyces]|uniref:ABC transporter permease n=2 Tax=Streptomyces TaxID=1883 RepID=A0ABU4K9I0_9ACTN|nr:ABC transporter permease [Streptomyces roseolus]MDX2294420.1 ABC transporter permease [Streptomyces roseolus]
MRLAFLRRRAFPQRAIRLSRLTWRDLISEAAAGILQRPMRSILTSLGTVLGVGTFVAILGLTATASSQIDGRFNALSATEVHIEDVAREVNPFAGLGFPGDSEHRITRLNGVQHAGVYWPIDLPEETEVRSSPVSGGRGNVAISVMAASSGVLDAAVPEVAEGSTFNAWHDQEAQRVAVIGTGIASRLGITTVETRPAVFIDDKPFTVIGIVESVQRNPDLLMSILIPRSTAEQIWGAPKSSAKMLVATAPGAATQVATEAAVALDPAHPEYFKAVPPPDPKALRNGVSGDLDQLFLLLAAICLFIGSIGIANTTLVAVLERTGEIGLRRALGARGRHITGQFLAESSALGTLGGLVGTSLGTLTVVTVAVARDWTPVVHPMTVTTAPAIGLLTGLLAGLYPAWRASRIQPVEALRR